MRYRAMIMICVAVAVVLYAFFVGCQTLTAQSSEVEIIFSPAYTGVSTDVAFNSAAVKVDGRIDESEWLEATAFTGFIDNTSRAYAAGQSTVYASYDNTGISFALLTPEEARQVLIALKPGDKLFSFSLSDDGRVGCDSASSAGKVEMKLGRDSGKRVWEVHIPYSAVGTKAPSAGDSWQANFVVLTATPDAHTSWVARYADGMAEFPDEELGELVFRNDGTYLKVISLGQIQDARLRVDGSIYTKGEGNAPHSVWVLFPCINDFGGGYPYARAVKYTPGKVTPFSLVTMAAGTFEDESINSISRPYRFTYVSMNYSGKPSETSWNDETRYKTQKFPVGKPFDKIYLSEWHNYDKADKLVIDVETLGLAPEEVGTTGLQTSLASPSGKTLAGKTISGVKPGKYTLTFDSNLLEAGENKFTAVLKDGAGREIASLQKSIEKPDLNTIGKTIGISDKIPAPFEPLRRKGDSVLVWGREYTLKGGSIFSAVTSQGKSLLASPITLTVSLGGKPVALKSTGWKFEKMSGTAAVAVNKLTSDRFDLKIKNTIEYDGMVRVDATVIPKGRGVSLDGLRLRIPVKPEHAEYLNWTRGRSSGMPEGTNWSYGAFPKDGFKGDFRPFLWVGDEDRGLLWFAECPQNWNVKAKDSVLAAERQSGITVTMIDTPTQFEESTTFTFGLHASPVKPRPADWRGFAKGQVFGGSVSDGHAVHGYVPREIELGKEKLPEFWKQGLKPVIYAYPNHMGVLTPGYEFIADLARTGGARNVGQKTVGLDNMCTNTVWTDFYLTVLERALDMSDNRHSLLYDLSWTNECVSEVHGACGYRDREGNLQSRYNIFSTRELFQRIYTMYAERAPEYVIIGHSSANTCQLPIYSFVHATWDGEQYHAGEDYMTDVTPDKWRAELTHRQFGTVPMLMPLLRYIKETTEPTYAFVAMANLHDIIIYHGFADQAVVSAFEKVRGDFGVAEPDTKFIPYWEAMGRTFKTSNPDVLVSAYKRPGKVLLVVVNMNEKAAEVDLKMDIKALGIGGKDAVLFSGPGSSRPVSGGESIRLSIAGKHPVFLTMH